MAWTVSADVEQFDAALEHFLDRTVLTDAERLAIPNEAATQAFWISGATELDTVQFVHDEIAKALASGAPFEEFKKNVSEKLTKAWGKENPARIETIFRTATQTAYNAGRYAQMTEPSVLKFRPYWLFDAVIDSHTTATCRICNQTLLPADSPWWDSHTPPLHFSCRSGIRNLRVAEAEKKGVTEAPDAVPPDGFGASPKVAQQWRPDPVGKDPALMAELRRKVADADLKRDPLPAE